MQDAASRLVPARQALKLEQQLEKMQADNRQLLRELKLTKDGLKRQEQKRKAEIERIARVGFETAKKRNNRLCSVEKSNVLEVSQLWKEVVSRVHEEEYPDVELSHMYVDNAAMQIIRAPTQFDTIVTGNIFGDILSDAASMLTGSIGMLPSAAVGTSGPGLYEPVHGSAPDIAGTDKANPLAQVLSAAMMLRYQFGEEEAAAQIEKAVNDALDEGYRTGDIMSDGCTQVGCNKMGEILMEKIKA